MKRIIKIVVMLALLAIAQLAPFFALAFCVIGIFTGSNRAWRIIISYDQLMNAATGGSEDETISSRAYRGMKEGNGGWCLLCRFLDLIDKDHCKKSEGV